MYVIVLEDTQLIERGSSLRTTFQGTTRLLLTKIPFYKDVILMSFECEHCGHQNNEIQSGGKVEEKGIRIKLKAETEDDLNRTLVKSDFTSVTIPELDFEIPANSQKGGKNVAPFVFVTNSASLTLRYGFRL